MKLSDLTESSFIIETKIVWSRKGNSLTRKYRCTVGPRKGKTVSDIAQCYAAKDIAKKQKLAITKKLLGRKMAKKAKRTKKVNPISRKLRSLNR